MNYIHQLNGFGEFVIQYPLPTKGLALYYGLLHMNNKCRWRKDFTVANLTLQTFCSLSRSELHKARSILIKLGLIEYQKGKGSRAGVYTIVNLYDTDRDGPRDGYPNPQGEKERKGKGETEREIQREAQIETQIETQNGSQVEAQSDAEWETKGYTPVDTFLAHNWNTLIKHKEKPTEINKYKEQPKEKDKHYRDQSLVSSKAPRDFRKDQEKEVPYGFSSQSNGKSINLDEGKFIYKG